MKKDKILVVGACGQIGTELTSALRRQYGLSALTREMLTHLALKTGTPSLSESIFF